MNIIGITKGFTNLMLGKHQNLKNTRTAACKLCPISKSDDGRFTNYCLSDKGGCGCYIPAKTSAPDEVCPYSVWDDKGNIDLNNIPIKYNSIKVSTCKDCKK